MKKVIGLLFVAALFALSACGHTELAIGIGLAGAALANTPQANVLTSGIDVSQLALSLVKWGGQIIMKNVNAWDPGADFMIAKNVKMPLPLPRIATSGEPQLYRAQQDDSGNSIDMTDRVLTVRQSKWDFVIDPEKFRNTYLAESGTAFDPNVLSFPQYITGKLVEDYLANINDKCILNGVYNSSGTATVDIMDGLVEILSGMSLTPVATGTINSSNAVAKVKAVCSAVPAWMRQQGFVVYCSFEVFDMYTTNVETSNPFQYDPNATDSYKIKGFNATLQARSYMEGTQGLIALPSKKKNLWLGTDGESVAVHATPRMNVIDFRLMMPIGMQIADPDAVVINDQF